MRWRQLKLQQICKRSRVISVLVVSALGVVCATSPADGAATPVALAASAQSASPVANPPSSGAQARERAASKAAESLPADKAVVETDVHKGLQSCASKVGRRKSGPAWCGSGRHFAMREVTTADGGTTCVNTRRVVSGREAKPCLISPPKKAQPSRPSAAGGKPAVATLGSDSLSSTGWDVSLSYTGTSSLTFTATVNQPLDDSGKMVEIFETTWNASTQYLGWCTKGTTCTVAATAPHATTGHFVAVISPVFENHYSDYEAGQKVAESAIITPPPWTLTMTASVTTSLGLTATTNYLPSAAGAYIEIFEAKRAANITYLGWTQDSTYTASTAPHAHRASFVAVVGFTLANTFEEYPDWAKLAQSNEITPPPWVVTLEADGSPVAVTNYDVAAAGAYTEIFDLSDTFVVTYRGWCHSGTVCVQSARQGPYLATVSSTLSNKPVPSPLYAISNQAGAAPMSAQEAFSGYDPSELLQCLSCLGDPVNTSTGEFFTTFTDMAVAGRGPTLNVTRTYSSARASVDGPFGLGWATPLGMRLSSDPSTGAVEVLQENGSVITFLPNADGSYSAPPRVLASLTRNTDGSWRLVRKARSTFDFSESGALTAIRDVNDESVSIAYTSDGEVARAVSSSGRSISFDTTAGHVTSAVDPTGGTTHYAYDPYGRLTKVTDPAGAQTTYAYDDNDLLTAFTDPLGNTRTNTYDALHRVVAQTDPVGGQTRFDYTGVGVCTVTTPGGRVTQDVYTNGVLTSQTDGYGTPDAATTTFTYDPSLLSIATTTDPRGKTTSVSTSPTGDVVSVTDALGHKTSLDYDALHDPIAVTDAVGATATSTFDSQGNLTAMSRTHGSSTATIELQHSTTHPGDLLTVTDATGRVTTMTYSPAGDLTSITDPGGDTAAFTYDAAGRQTSATTPRGNATSTTYDADGRRTATTDPLGHRTTWTYNLGGQLTASTDAAGHETTFSYGDRGLLTATKAPDGSVTTYTYDADGLLLTRADPAGNTTTYSYDGDGRPASVTDALGRTTSVTYDPAGNVLTRTDPDGHTTTFTYDALDHLTATSYPGGTTADTTVAYDALGRVTSRNDASGSSTVAYDDLGRVTSTTNGNGQTVGYQWDLAGRLLSLTYPNGKEVTRHYSPGGELSRITDWLGNSTTLTHNKDGNIQKAQFGTGAAQVNTYDALDAMTGTTVTGPDGQSISATTYKHNALAQVITSASASGSHTYDYTPLNQLAGDATSDTSSTSFTYDAARNRTTVAAINAPGTATLTYDAANQPSRYTNADGDVLPMQYDANGNRLSGPGADGTPAAYTYNDANQLRDVTVGSASASYVHEASGLTASATTNGTTKRFAWSADSVPRLLSDGATNYIYDENGLPIEEIDTGGAVVFYQHDQYGSTTSVTSTTGTVLATYSYSPDGRTLTHTGSLNTPLQWGGQYQDPFSGLYDLRARSYDPVTAQFITRDPLVDITQAPYSYASNDPVNRADPTGLWDRGTWTLIGAGAVAVAGAALIATGVGSPLGAGLEVGAATMATEAGAEAVVAAETATAVEEGSIATEEVAEAGEAACAQDSAAARSVDEGVDLFRHAGQSELSDIQRSGIFRSGGSSMEGKWFAESADHARQWGGILNGGKGAVVTTRVPTAVAGRMMRLEKLDGIGPARYASDLGELNRTMSAIRVLP